MGCPRTGGHPPPGRGGCSLFMPCTISAPVPANIREVARRLVSVTWRLQALPPISAVGLTARLSRLPSGALSTKLKPARGDLVGQIQV